MKRGQALTMLLFTVSISLMVVPASVMIIAANKIMNRRNILRYSRVSCSIFKLSVLYFKFRFALRDKVYHEANAF